MSSFRDDRAVAARILAHIESGTTDASDGVWREPVANYRSPERRRAELEVLRRHPRPLCPAAAVPEAGQYLTVRADGRSIVVVRGSDGVEPASGRMSHTQRSEVLLRRWSFGLATGQSPGCMIDPGASVGTRG